MRLLLSLSAMTSLALSAASHACWQDVGQRYGVSPALLYAIAQVESGLNPRAVNTTHQARTGSYDIGLMQINSRHLPLLARHGISERALYDPCMNLAVGAWILAANFAREGNNWNAIGAYNASCRQLRGEACLQARARYAWRVYRQLPVAVVKIAAPDSRPIRTGTALHRVKVFS